jgi:hypothetical protein
MMNVMSIRGVMLMSSSPLEEDLYLLVAINSSVYRLRVAAARRAA